ncbi:MAG: beta-propeller domain-containing protein [Candidatus Altarchaeum sp.]|nr:beta-propeller domain-containing protein [Candidatus Altarchaeum sp.]
MEQKTKNNTGKKILKGVGILALAVIGIVLISGCIEEKLEGNITANENDAPMKKFSSQEELNAYIKYSTEYLSFSYDKRMELSSRNNKYNSNIIATKIATKARDAAGASDFSQTNIQVQGVDEADIVKNSGKYIYVISGKKVVIIDAYPAEKAKILSTIELKEQPNEIFINKDKLIIFTQEYNYNDRCPYCYGSYTKTNILIYNISNREKPKLAKEIKSDGIYFDSRMIGDYVYVIINEPIYYRLCPIYGEDVIKTTRELINDCVEQDIEVPETTIETDDKITTYKEFSDIYYWDILDYSYRFTTILAINTDDDNEKINRKLFVMSDAYDMFVSMNNIYITRTKWQDNYELQERIFDEIIIPNLPDDIQKKITEIENSNKPFYIKKFERNRIIKKYSINPDGNENKVFEEKINKKIKELQREFEKNQEQTAINKIAINNGKITPYASGNVPGRVLNQFSMDEYKENFRIATTANWGQSSTNNVYVLDDELKIIGKLEYLAPGESIYSARFIGDRCYLVTFVKIDPLFVIDLSNPTEPEVLGKLKIPGYSDYLHPYDENHIIGIGKEAVDAKEGYFSWYQGVKLSLFDVSDVKKPKEISKYDIGDRGTDSYALHDHKAFLFSKSKNLLVIPILLAEIDEEKYPGGVQPNTYGDYVWQGAYVFNITTDKGFELKGRVTHTADSKEFIKSGWYYGESATSVKRSLYIDDVLYTISNKKVKMNDLKNITEINEVELPYEDYYDGNRYYHERV